jgi:uncharacterized protein (DUF488 family)
MTTKRSIILTIGHSTHSLGQFVALLASHGVTVLADVRSTPFSRFNPQFNKDAIARGLKEHGIKYVFLGVELGARSSDRALYDGGRVSYARLAQTERFKQGIERVLRGAEEHRIALMCAEKEPLECHRTLLVARVLEDRGVDVSHILGDGRLESHRHAMERLLDVIAMPREDLFRPRQELIAEALARQEAKIAYIDEKPQGAHVRRDP